MRRLQHIVFSSVAFFSVLLFLLFCAIWPVSHWRSLSLNLHMGSADPRHNFRTDLYLDVLRVMISVRFGRDTMPAFLQQVQQRKLSGIEPREFDLSGQWSGSSWSLYPPDHQFIGIGGEFSSQKGPAKDEPFDGFGLFGAVTPCASASGLLQSPIWLPFMAAALFPLLWASSFVRTYRQRRRGVCRNCGYDLRATPTRCPECGVEPTATIEPSPPRIKIKFLLLAAALLVCVGIGILWAVSYHRSFQVTLQSPIEQLQDDVDRSAQLTIHDGVLAASRQMHLQAILQSDLNERQQHGPSPRDVTFEAHWLPRNEDGNFPIVDDPPMEHSWHDIGYTRTGGDSLQFRPAQPMHRMEWSAVAAQCPLWSILLIAVSVPLAGTTMLVISRRRRTAKGLREEPASSASGHQRCA